MAALILLADNIPDHASRYDEVLKAHGYRVLVATSGREAIEAACRVEPDCAVIDVRLPDMSGWDLCAELKGRAATRNVPVMVLTPDTSRAHALESARVHCNAWIAQPVQAEELVRTVEHVLSREESAPRTAEDAVLGVPACPVCASDQVRATLRMSPIQYYSCQACGHRWRVEAT